MLRNKLDEEVQALHEHLKSKGLWKKGYGGSDGSWNKPRPALHGVFVARNLQKSAAGGILGYAMFSCVDLKCPYLGTSDSMEVLGIMMVMSKLATLGFGTESLKMVCDGDTHCAKVCKKFFPCFFSLCCSNHINKNWGKTVERASASKPQGCVCHGKKHKHKPPYCGCFQTQQLVRFLKAANMKIMMKAGERRDPEFYRRWLDALEDCVFHDKHHDCAHHDEFKGNDFKTPVSCLVTCPYHRKVLQDKIKEMRENAHRMIDTEHGRYVNDFIVFCD